MADTTGALTFCGECGTRARAGAAFCASCGEPLSALQQGGANRAGSYSDPSPMASRVVEGRPEQRWDSLEDRKETTTSGAEEEESGRSSRGPVAASERSGGGSGFDLHDPVVSFLETVHGVVLQPSRFFSGLPRRGDFVSPLAFAVICGVMSGILGGIISFFSDLWLGLGFAFTSFLTYIIAVPIGTMIGVFIAACVFHLLVLLFVRLENAGFEATFRATAYASSVVVLGVCWLTAIPIFSISALMIVGIIELAVGIYYIFVKVIAIREAHATTTGAAARVVLIPVAVATAIVVVIAIASWLLISALFAA